jgi:hypothetical protein
LGWKIFGWYDVKLKIIGCKFGTKTSEIRKMSRAYIWNNVFKPWIELHELVEPVTDNAARILFAVVEDGVLEVHTSFDNISCESS